MTKTSLQQFPIHRVIFWSAALIISVVLFAFVRTFTICWRLTALPGIPSADCAGEAVHPIETPVIGKDQNTLVPTMTPEPPVPEEVEYETWDGGSRINILFVGLRGDSTGGGCPHCTD